MYFAGGLEARPALRHIAGVQRARQRRAQEGEPLSRRRILCDALIYCAALQNITLKHVGQDGESADAITRTIIKAVEQVGEGPRVNVVLSCSLIAHCSLC